MTAAHALQILRLQFNARFNCASYRVSHDHLWWIFSCFRSLFFIWNVHSSLPPLHYLSGPCTSLLSLSSVLGCQIPVEDFWMAVLFKLPVIHKINVSTVFKSLERRWLGAGGCVLIAHHCGLCRFAPDLKLNARNWVNRFYAVRARSDLAPAWFFFQLELAEICQHCERYIGTEGGGMDQSISFLAQSGTVSNYCLAVYFELFYKELFTGFFSVEQTGITSQRCSDLPLYWDQRSSWERAGPGLEILIYRSGLT